MFALSVLFHVLLMLLLFFCPSVIVLMVLKLGIGIGIGCWTVESESDESAGISRVDSVTRVFLAEACFVAKM